MTDVAKPSCAPTPIGCHRNARAMTPKNDQAIQRRMEATSELFSAKRGKASIDS
jgi:hypothetical protein